MFKGFDLKDWKDCQIMRLSRTAFPGCPPLGCFHQHHLPACCLPLASWVGIWASAPEVAVGTVRLGTAGSWLFTHHLTAQSDEHIHTLHP